MQPDEVINHAMKAEGGMRNFKLLLAIEENVERSEPRVRDLKRVYIDNYFAF